MEIPFSVLSEVVAALERLQIRYVLVGSFASSMHGMYRSTADIDILADINADQIRPLLDALQAFYVDEHAMRDAVTRRRSFNVIHYDSVFKVDIFVPQSDDFSRVQLERRQLRKISPDREDTVFVASAEDTVLAKLRWYKAGEKTSSTQWNDVAGILAVSRDVLDLSYLRDWAQKLGVTDLLEQALAEVEDDRTK